MSLSEATRNEGIRAAMFEGFSATAAVSAALAAAHFALRRTPSYAATPAPPLRVLVALIVTGTFFYTSGLSHAHHTVNANVLYMTQKEEEERARRRSLGAGSAPRGGAGPPWGGPAGGLRWTETASC